MSEQFPDIKSESTEQIADQQFPDSYWDRTDGRWPLLDRPENTLDSYGNEIDIVALKERFRGAVGSQKYEYLVDVASAIALDSVLEMHADKTWHQHNTADYRNVKKREGFAYNAAQLAAHYATWMQWVVNLPDEQWPAGHSQPEFITYAEELAAKLKGSEE